MRTNLRIRTALALLFVALAATVSIAHPDHGPGSSVRFSHVFEPFHALPLVAAFLFLLAARRSYRARRAVVANRVGVFAVAIETLDRASRAAFADFVREEASARACPNCGSTFECSPGECANAEPDDEPTEFERASDDRRRHGYDPARIEQAG